MSEESTAGAAAATGIILATLAAGQFVMALDTTVMNTAIATVADDVDSTVSGIQTAITLYALVMASLMITGGKLGAIMGRKRAFSIGCVIYACGSLTTSLAPNLTVLMIGWSFLEGLGAVLIMPAIVGLVASNFGRSERPRAYGLVAAAAAMAAALGPVIGGAFTTYASWRWVFAGEVVIILGILVLARRMKDTPAEEGVRLDLVGTVLSALGLGLDRPGHPEVGHVGLRPAQARCSGVARALACDLDGPGRRCRAGRSCCGRTGASSGARARSSTRACCATSSCETASCRSCSCSLSRRGCSSRFPLFLSVALGLSAIETGVRLLPLSLSLLLFAAGIPKLWPHVSPQRVVRLGFVSLFAGLVLLVALLDVGAGPEVITWPLLLAGAGLGAMASQLGSVTVSSVPDEQSGEVGGLQNTGTQLGAAIGTALAGAVLISALTASFFTGIQENPAVPESVAAQAEVELAGGVEFVSDDYLEEALSDADVPAPTADAIVETNEQSRIDGLRVAMALLATPVPHRVAIHQGDPQGAAG